MPYQFPNWREANAPFVQPDDCRNCSGSGRVPYAVELSPGCFTASYRPCPHCGGSGDRRAQWRSRMNRLLQFFKFDHLPPSLRGPSQACHDLAVKMEAGIPDGPEKTVGLRKLLEAKDCFVRALLEVEQMNQAPPQEVKP